MTSTYIDSAAYQAILKLDLLEQAAQVRRAWWSLLCRRLCGVATGEPSFISFFLLPPTSDASAIKSTLERYLLYNGLELFIKTVCFWQEKWKNPYVHGRFYQETVMFVEIVYHAQITRRKKRRVDIRLFYVIIALYPIRYRILVKFLNDAVHFCLPSRFHLFLDRKIFRHWSYLLSLECKSYYSPCKDITGFISISMK